ncbi:hypothetical protein [Halopseudomonas bauzanensis]|uniref:hypothetical protein n=1 Tax=Halopseudomonas bauzanensis TaxID=653930 RepID=UPI002554CAA7|nr:hypothetical protein [Halopseudomonas bauzanensis]
MLEGIIATFAGLGGVIGAIFAVRRIYGLLLPINVSAGVRVHLDKSAKDEILATVTNRSSEAVYLIKCRGRSANPLSYIFKTHLRHPFIKPRLYKNVRFGAPVYEMIDSGPLRLEPGQPVSLSHQLSFDLPIFAFTNTMVQVEVVLSNGRVFRSRRLKIPAHWHVAKHLKRSQKSK